MTSPTGKLIVENHGFVYSLMHDKWVCGVEQFRNRVTICISYDREVEQAEKDRTAKMIAAAAEMFALLRRIDAGPEGLVHVGEMGRIVDAAREIIARIENQ